MIALSIFFAGYALGALSAVFALALMVAASWRCESEDERL